MEAIRPPKTVKYYQLLRMATKNGLNLTSCGTSPASGANYIGVGFYTTQQEAEHNRTMETLKDVETTNSYYIFELEFPNPAYKE